MALRKARERGRAQFGGWLDSRHTFSFASYYDPRHMGFGHLRVINQDKVAAGGGFPTHSHRNMEILSYVVDGALQHADTIGTGSVIRPGEVQLMSAGRGIAHSEMNASGDERVQFLQIWLLPDRANTEPSYQQQTFAGRGATLVVSPDGRDGSLSIKQDVDIHRLLLDDGEALALPLGHQRAWVQVITGQLQVNGALLQPGDGAALEDVRQLDLRADGDVEALAFDLL